MRKWIINEDTLNDVFFLHKSVRIDKNDVYNIWRTTEGIKIGKIRLDIWKAKKVQHSSQQSDGPTALVYIINSIRMFVCLSVCLSV